MANISKIYYQDNWYEMKKINSSNSIIEQLKLDHKNYQSVSKIDFKQMIKNKCSNKEIWIFVK